MRKSRYGERQRKREGRGEGREKRNTRRIRMERQANLRLLQSKLGQILDCSDNNSRLYSAICNNKGSACKKCEIEELSKVFERYNGRLTFISSEWKPSGARGREESKIDFSRLRVYRVSANPHAQPESKDFDRRFNQRHKTGELRASDRFNASKLAYYARHA